jgi:hypothetical protein
VPTNVDALAQFPLDPLEFYLQAKGAAATEMSVFAGLHDELTKAVAENRWVDRTVNPRALFLEKLTVDGTPALQAAVPEVEAEARVFGLGFWQTWLENYAYTVSVSNSMVRGNRVSNDPFAPLLAVDVEKNLGSEIVKAIKALGKDAAWVEQYSGVAKQRADAEKERLDEQAKTGIIKA